MLQSTWSLSFWWKPLNISDYLCQFSHPFPESWLCWCSTLKALLTAQWPDKPFRSLSCSVFAQAAKVHRLIQPYSCSAPSLPSCRSVTDPRDGKRVALKKMPNVFQNLVSCKRVFRELKMLCFFKHDNVSRTKQFVILFSSPGAWVPVLLFTSAKHIIIQKSAWFWPTVCSVKMKVRRSCIISSNNNLLTVSVLTVKPPW